MKKNYLMLVLCAFATFLEGQTIRGLFVPNANGGTTPATGEKRIALVIGNKSYSNAWLPLKNPINDARTISKSLEDCGFEVMTVTDVGRSRFLESVRTFKAKIAGTSTVALFYYAGHGFGRKRRKLFNSDR